MNDIIHVYTYTDIQDPVESSQGSDEDETHWEGSFFQRGLETNWHANTRKSGDAELVGWGERGLGIAGSSSGWHHACSGLAETMKNILHFYAYTVYYFYSKKITNGKINNNH